MENVALEDKKTALIWEARKIKTDILISTMKSQNKFGGRMLLAIKGAKLSKSSPSSLTGLTVFLIPFSKHSDWCPYKSKCEHVIRIQFSTMLNQDQLCWFPNVPNIFHLPVQEWLSTHLILWSILPKWATLYTHEYTSFAFCWFQPVKVRRSMTLE